MLCGHDDLTRSTIYCIVHATVLRQWHCTWTEPLNVGGPLEIIYPNSVLYQWRDLGLRSQVTKTGKTPKTPSARELGFHTQKDVSREGTLSWPKPLLWQRLKTDPKWPHKRWWTERVLFRRFGYLTNIHSAFLLFGMHSLLLVPHPSNPRIYLVLTEP